MRFNPRDLAEPAADLRYAPNKLHGDEIEAADGSTYREQHPHEWLSNREVDELIQRSPALDLLLVDDTAGYPPQVYRVPGDPMKSWTRRLSTLYISDDGNLDQRIGWSLMAYRWAAADGSQALVFRFNC